VVVVVVVLGVEGALLGRREIVDDGFGEAGPVVAEGAPMVTAGRGCGAGWAKLPTETVSTAAALSPTNATAGTRRTGLSITPPSRT
jgi:hypothetical protein